MDYKLEPENGVICNETILHTKEILVDDDECDQHTGTYKNHIHHSEMLSWKFSDAIY
jgi:hypothetical protein